MLVWMSCHDQNFAPGQEASKTFGNTSEDIKARDIFYTSLTHFDRI